MSRTIECEFTPLSWPTLGAFAALCTARRQPDGEGPEESERRALGVQAGAHEHGSCQGGGVVDSTDKKVLRARDWLGTCRLASSRFSGERKKGSHMFIPTARRRCLCVKCGVFVEEALVYG